MKKNHAFWIMGVLLPLIGWLWLGCAQSPQEKILRAETKVAQTEEKIQSVDAQRQQEAAGMVYATDLALDHAEASKPVELAQAFNDRAQTLLGAPELMDAAQLRQLVNDLLSEMKQERQRGEDALKKLDKELAALASEKNRLHQTLVLTQKKLETVHQENILMAEKEHRRQSQWWNPFYDLSLSLKKFLVWGILILGLVLLLPILSAVFPVMLPVVSAIGVFLGKAIGWLIRIVPGAISGAGVVGKKIFETVNSTKQRIIEAIEQWQQTQKLQNKTEYKSLSGYLAEILDWDNKNEVIASKQKIGATAS
ncbi:MAG: hypothetical protein ACOY3I_07705 [Verrucomicrobiota bacterium]